MTRTVCRSACSICFQASGFAGIDDSPLERNDNYSYELAHYET